MNSCHEEGVRDRIERESKWNRGAGSADLIPARFRSRTPS
eukprot:gene26491-biopygen16649